MAPFLNGLDVLGGHWQAVFNHVRVVRSAFSLCEKARCGCVGDLSGSRFVEDMQGDDLSHHLLELTQVCVGLGCEV
jgi:hypothetical protein